MLDFVERVLPRIRRNRVYAFAVALLIFAAALAARFVLDPWVDQSLPFITFFVAVLLATLVGGLLPGLVTLGLSFFASWYFFLPPRHSLATDSDTVVALGVFVAQGALLTFVAHVLNRVVERLTFERERSEQLLERSARAETMLEDINEELRHRIKNIFAVISTLLSQSARYIPHSKDLAASVTGRLAAMGGAQDLLAGNLLRGADLAALIEQTLAPLRPAGSARYAVSGPRVFLGATATTPLALILHELATNAIKYGAWSNDAGAVSLSWRATPADDGATAIELEWRESGGPPVSSPPHAGFGTVLVERALPGAVVSRSFTDGGATCRIVFSVALAARESTPELGL